MKYLNKVFSRILADLRACRIALLAIMLYIVVTQSIFHTTCPMAILTGFPCPGCGLTRSGIWVVTGHFTEAWALNPTIYLWIPLIIYGMVFRYLLGRKPPFYLACVGIAGLLTCIWYLWALLGGYRVPLPYDGLLAPYFRAMGIFT